MILDSLKDLAAQSPAVASFAGFLLVASLVWYVIQRPQRLNFPVVDFGGDVAYDRALDEGYAKVSSCHNYETQARSRGTNTVKVSRLTICHPDQPANCDPATRMCK